jgi:hypothetical protein
MRRVYSSPEQRRRAARRAKYQLAQRRTHDRRARKRALDAPPTTPKAAAPGKWLRESHRLVAPANFSLVDNTTEVLSYFREAHLRMRKKERIVFDMENVARLTPDAIALLVANVNDSRFRSGQDVSGSVPRDATAARMIEESGFYEHVQTRRKHARARKHVLLHRITLNRVENEQAKAVSEMAVKHLYNDGRRIRPLYEVLIECMANTNNHAQPSHRGMYDWWLFLYNDPDKPRCVFTFLDLGVGIFRSLPVRNFWRDPLRATGLKGNLSILDKLFAGEISSRTGMRERGKGIPRIHHHATGGTFSRFTMIANDVHCDLIDSSRHYLKPAFGGTFFSFEISAPPQAALPQEPTT